MAKNWYILHTYTGYEKKIERTIRTRLETKEIDPSVVTEIRVPEEELVEVKDGKQRTKKNKFLPGYIMVEMDLPELDWKKTCTALRRIQGVTGFVGTNPSERPRPISVDEAKTLLQKAGAIKGEKPVHIKQSFAVGDTVKITDGPFATFSGTVDEVNAEKDKLRVVVQIFGRATPVEVSLSQVEKM
ncbi:MAG: transcription termination/antitermination factor NusG [Treponema sp.]|nr:transcription termination/antitermination factor NusG [Treponema sp.]